MKKLTFYRERQNLILNFLFLLKDFEIDLHETISLYISVIVSLYIYEIDSLVTKIGIEIDSY